MIWVDYAILVIISISALISILRGFVREALSLLGWILAIWVSFTFVDEVAALLVDHISVPSVRTATAFLALFFACLLVAGLVNLVMGKIVEKTGLSGTDRMLGVVFGTVRGAVVVGILVLLAGFTSVPKDLWWSQSLLLKHFQSIALELRDFMPPDIAANINY